MRDNYEKIALDNLDRLYSNLPEDLAANLPGEQDGSRFVFDAFGEPCAIEPGGITPAEKEYSSVLNLLISLYALHACPDNHRVEPLKAFKEFAGSFPYVKAFATHTEQILVPHVEQIKAAVEKINSSLKGSTSPSGTGGDFSFLLYPLPKIALCYIFYEADEDFPASVTCLYSNNADRFMPTGALADVGEYTSRTILDLIN